MQQPQLTPQIQQTLERYLQIQQEEKRLRDEKRGLQEQLAQHLGNPEKMTWRADIAGQRIKVRCQTTVDVQYDEPLLRRRLGDRYATILAPDLTKIRRNLKQIEGYLRPAILEIGSPDRDKVRGAVQQGIVTTDEFAGAFEKTTKSRVSVAPDNPNLPPR